MSDSDNPAALVSGWRSVRVWVAVALASIGSCAATATGFWLGTQHSRSTDVLPPVMAATAAHSDTMAVATGLISEDVEGIFFLDFITGQLQCLVYYPRQQAFGAHFWTNVNPHFPPGKNKKYLLSTGLSVPRQVGVGATPSASLVYVTDVNAGMFAAFTVPWDRSAEPSGRRQINPLVWRGGGRIRDFQLTDPQPTQPAAIVDPNQPKNP